jgi:hypothetical protein
MVTFTLPEELRGPARSNQRIVYHLLFRASADPRFVVGLSPDGSWLRSRSDFFVYVKPLSTIFRSGYWNRNRFRG